MLISATMVAAALGAFSGIVAAGFVIFEWQLAAKVMTGLGLFLGGLSILISARESAIANRAHFGELDVTVAKDDPYHTTSMP